MSDKCEYLYIGGMRVPMENVLVTVTSWNGRKTQSFRVVTKSPGTNRGEPPMYATIKELKKLLKDDESSTINARIYDPEASSPLGEPFEFNPSKTLGHAGRKHAAKEGRSNVWAQFEPNEFVAGLLAKGVSYGASKGLDAINTAQLDWLARTPAGVTVLDNILNSTDPSMNDIKCTLAAAVAADAATIVPLSSKITEAFSKLAPLAVALGFAKAASTTDLEQGNEDGDPVGLGPVGGMVYPQGDPVDSPEVLDFDVEEIVNRINRDKSQKSGASSSARVLATIASTSLSSEVEVASFKKSLETARAEDAKAVEKESIEIDKKFKEKSAEKAKLSAESRKKERDIELSIDRKFVNDEVTNARSAFSNNTTPLDSPFRSSAAEEKEWLQRIVKGGEARQKSINEKHDALDSAALAQEAKADAHIAKLMETTRAADAADIEKRDIEVDKVLQEFFDQKKSKI